METDERLVEDDRGLSDASHSCYYDTYAHDCHIAILKSHLCLFINTMTPVLLPHIYLMNPFLDLLIQRHIFYCLCHVCRCHLLLFRGTICVTICVHKILASEMHV